MKKTILLATLLVPAITFTSCLNSDGDNTQKTTINYGNNMCFNVVTDMNDPEHPFITTAPNYIIDINFTEGTGVMSMSNIKFTPNGSNLTYRLPAMPLTISNTDYSYNLKGSLLTPEGQEDQIMFNNVSFSIIERSISISGQLGYAPIYKLDFTASNLSNNYKISAFPHFYYFPADDIISTPLNSESDDEPYTYNNAVVRIVLTPDKTDSQKLTASLTLFDVKFNSSMSTVSLSAENLPVKVDSNGFSITTEEDKKIELKDATGVMKDCSISNIKTRTLVPQGNTTMSFDIDLEALNPQHPIKPCHVNASLTYTYPKKDNN